MRILRFNESREISISDIRSKIQNNCGEFIYDRFISDICDKWGLREYNISGGLENIRRNVSQPLDNSFKGNGFQSTIINNGVLIEVVIELNNDNTPVGYSCINSLKSEKLEFTQDILKFNKSIWKYISDMKLKLDWKSSTHQNPYTNFPYPHAISTITDGGDLGEKLAYFTLRYSLDADFNWEIEDNKSIDKISKILHDIDPVNFKDTIELYNSKKWNIKENVSDDRFPTKVNKEEFMKKRNVLNMESWDTPERKNLLDFGRTKHLRINIDYDYVEYWTDQGRHIEICKLVDSWFTIIVTDRWNQSEYYLADEFDEVMTWLNRYL